MLTLHEFLNECELAVFAKIEQSTHHYLEVNFDKIVQFLPYAEDRKRAVSFSIKHASLLVQHHKRLSEETISYLALNWFGKAFSEFSELTELLQFEISVKLLHSSIQHNKDAVYQHFISLIQRLVTKPFSKPIMKKSSEPSFDLIWKDLPLGLNGP